MVIVDKLPWVIYAAIWAVGVGYWFVPTEPRARLSDTAPVEQASTHAPADAAEPTVIAMRMTNVGMPSSPSGLSSPSTLPSPSLVHEPSVPVSAPELLERIRPVLNRGTNLAAASAEFDDPIQFAAVAHAAHNTRVPFMVLKHRVVREGMTLAEAIRASLPQTDAEIEADLAVAEARSDVAAVAR